MVKVEVFGLLRAVDCAKAEQIAKSFPHSDEVTIHAMLEVDWQSYIQQLRPKGLMLGRDVTALVFFNGELLESVDAFHSLAMELTGISGVLNEEEMRQIAEEEYVSYLSKSQQKYVCWEVTIGEGNPRRVILQLDENLCPKTVQNFWQLTCGSGFLQYKGSFFHRVVEDGYIEGGLLKTTSGKRVNCAISGEMFLDENYAYKHDRAGVIGLSRSVPNRNGSAFYITLRPMPSLDTKNVAFGRVIEGLDVIQDIARLPTKNQRPLVSCKIIKSIPYLRPEGKIVKVIDSPGDESRPHSKMEQTRILSKLESADIDTLTLRRDAIVKDLEKTQEELEEQETMLRLVQEILSQRE